MCTCVYSAHMCVHICVHMCVRACVCAHVYVHMCVHMCVHCGCMWHAHCVHRYGKKVLFFSHPKKKAKNFSSRAAEQRHNRAGAVRVSPPPTAAHAVVDVMPLRS